MARTRAPSEVKAPALAQLLRGQALGQDGPELVRAFGRCATERVLHAALEHAQAVALGRDRYDRRALGGGERQGDAAGTVQTAAGGLRWPRPPVRGLRAPDRAPCGAALGRTRAVLATLLGALEAGGRAQRARETALEKACGPCVRAKRALSAIPARWTQA